MLSYPPMEPTEFIRNLAVWVHTCPQREKSLEETLQSLHQSDIPSWEVFSAGKNGKPLSWHDTLLWWLDRWLDMSKRADWVLRLEDDIVVGKFIGHNFATWPAINESDFGMGLGFVFDSTVRDNCGIEFLSNGVVRAKAKGFAAGQAQLMRSDVIQELVPKLQDVLTSDKLPPGYHPESPVWFDVGITEQLYRLGYRTYLHIPSIVRTGTLSTTSVASNCERSDHYAHKTWRGADWKRPPDSREVDAEIILRGTRTRWAVLNTGSIVACSTPANLDPKATPVTINGRFCVMRSDALFDSYEEASRRQPVKESDHLATKTTPASEQPNSNRLVRGKISTEALALKEPVPTEEPPAVIPPARTWKRRR